MKNMKFLGAMFAIAGFIVLSNPAIAQGKVVNISKFEAGTTLTKDDVGFIEVITSTPENKQKLGASAPGTQVTVEGKKFTEGQKLSEEEAKLLNKKFSYYSAKNVLQEKKPENDPHKAGSSYCYWYYYCDYFGDCWYIWRCY